MLVKRIVKSLSPQRRLGSMDASLRWHDKSHGFSLIEIMIVLTLIGLIMAGVGVYVMRQLGKGQVSAARSKAMDISKALDLYRLDFGHYPTQAEGFEALMNPPRGEAYLDEVPMDPWGNPYTYVYPGEHNKKKPDIRSKGEDGIENNEDDVGNWADK